MNSDIDLRRFNGNAVKPDRIKFHPRRPRPHRNIRPQYSRLVASLLLVAHQRDVQSAGQFKWPVHMLWIAQAYLENGENMYHFLPNPIMEKGCFSEQSYQVTRGNDLRRMKDILKESSCDNKAKLAIWIVRYVFWRQVHMPLNYEMQLHLTTHSSLVSEERQNSRRNNAIRKADNHVGVLG